MVAPCVRLAAAWGTKKRVPESMPSPEALAQARVYRMGERARGGAVCLMDKHKVVS